MLNARTLAQAPTTDSDAPGAAAPGDESGAGTDSVEPLRPVEAFQTKGGVIVLSNRPASDEAAATPPADRETAPAPKPPTPTPAASAPGVKVVRQESTEVADERGGTGLWLLLAALAIAIAAVALLLVRRKRRRSTERYAALLAGSEPIAPEPEHVGPFARRSGVSVAPPSTRARPSALTTPSPAGRTPLPQTNDDASSPGSVPPPSGISAPPVSERQWLSQRPPRSYKEPPS